jgi:predicted HicB family RNase H-like nuclease
MLAIAAQADGRSINTLAREALAQAACRWHPIER